MRQKSTFAALICTFVCVMCDFLSEHFSCTMSMIAHPYLKWPILDQGIWVTESYNVLSRHTTCLRHTVHTSQSGRGCTRIVNHINTQKNIHCSIDKGPPHVTIWLSSLLLTCSITGPLSFPLLSCPLLSLLYLPTPTPSSSHPRLCCHGSKA